MNERVQRALQILKEAQLLREEQQRAALNAAIHMSSDAHADHGVDEAGGR